MMRYILSCITFPGVIAHEFAHARACRCMGVRVIKVCYLRIANPPGYVLHDRPATALQHIVIATAPLFISTFLALVISCAAGMFLVNHEVAGYHDAILVIAVWLSFSFALHAFPSSGDADALWSDVKSPHIGIAAKLLLVPVVGMIRLAGFSRYLHLDVVFAALVTAVPLLVAMNIFE